MPLGHVTGVVANITTMLRCAGALIIMPEFKAAEYLKVAARERVTYTVMVPAMYNLCLLQPNFDSYDLSSWRIGGFGGAPMPIATIERLATKIPGLKLANCYGATETTSPSTMMPGELTASHIDSVGLPCPGAEIIAMSADGHQLPPGEIGELWIRSASVIRGYWNNPKATAESFTAGFWHSGDLGSVDAENFVRVFDRQKDMINRGGLKIYSAEVESVLAGHADVVESAIIAKPCPVLGERVHAVVVTRNPVGAEALRAWCAERLSDYKVPETIDVTSDPLPRNANGKVMKRQLREAWAARARGPPPMNAKCGLSLGHHRVGWGHAIGMSAQVDQTCAQQNLAHLCGGEACRRRRGTERRSRSRPGRSVERSPAWPANRSAVGQGLEPGADCATFADRLPGRQHNAHQPRSDISGPVRSRSGSATPRADGLLANGTRAKGA